MPLTASKPAGTTDGDLLIAFAIHDTDPACPCTPPAAQGWTAFSLPGSETDFTSRAWYKEVDASDASRTDYTFTFAGGDNSAILYLAAFYEDSGTGTWTLEDGTGWAFADPVNSISNGGVTAVDNSLFVWRTEMMTTRLLQAIQADPQRSMKIWLLAPPSPPTMRWLMQSTAAFLTQLPGGGSAEELSAMAGIFSWETGSLLISGTVYTDEGVTNIGSGKTVRLLINGTSDGTDITDGSGNYSITPSSLSAGDAILVYVDDDASTDDGTTATVSDGSSLANLDIYKGHVITRHDNSGVLSNSNMDTAKGAYSDTDILYSVSGGALTVDSGVELYVASAHSFTPAGM